MFLKYLLLFGILLSCQGREVLPVEEEFPISYQPPIQDPQNNKRNFLISDAVQKKINRYESIVKKYAKRYGFDWRLIMAQIRQESMYNEKAKSHVGAKGLMQIMPGTANELGNELDVEFIYQNPRENIAAGIFHLYKQYRKLEDIRNKMDRIDMALAAYNAGMGRVRDARDVASVLYGDDQHWSAVSKAMTRLDAKNWKIHLQVWASGTPPHGYFNGEEETINYVININHYFESYKKFY